MYIIYNSTSINADHIDSVKYYKPYRNNKDTRMLAEREVIGNNTMLLLRCYIELAIDNSRPIKIGFGYDDGITDLSPVFIRELDNLNLNITNASKNQKLIEVFDKHIDAAYYNLYRYIVSILAYNNQPVRDSELDPDIKNNPFVKLHRLDNSHVIIATFELFDNIKSNLEYYGLGKNKFLRDLEQVSKEV